MTLLETGDFAMSRIPNMAGSCTYSNAMASIRTCAATEFTRWDARPERCESAIRAGFTHDRASSSVGRAFSYPVLTVWRNRA